MPYAKMKIHIASSLFRVVSTKNQTNNYIVFGGGISGVHLWGFTLFKTLLFKRANCVYCVDAYFNE